MFYNRQYWANGPSGGTPINAARLTHVELGIEELSEVIETGRLSEAELEDLLSNITAPVKTFEFNVPTTSWVLAHNFDRPYVLVTCSDQSDTEILGDVSFEDNNTVVVNWYFPTSGFAVVTF